MNGQERSINISFASDPANGGTISLTSSDGSLSLTLKADSFNVTGFKLENGKLDLSLSASLDKLVLPGFPTITETEKSISENTTPQINEQTATVIPAEKTETETKNEEEDSHLKLKPKNELQKTEPIKTSNNNELDYSSEQFTTDNTDNEFKLEKQEEPQLAAPTASSAEPEQKDAFTCTTGTDEAHGAGGDRQTAVFMKSLMEKKRPNRNTERHGEPEADIEWEPGFEEELTIDVPPPEKPAPITIPVPTEEEDDLGLKFDDEEPLELDTFDELKKDDNKADKPEEEPEIHEPDPISESIAMDATDSGLILEDENEKFGPETIKETEDKSDSNIIPEAEEPLSLDTPKAKPTQEQQTTAKEQPEEATPEPQQQKTPPLPGQPQKKETAAFIKYVCPKCKTPGSQAADKVGAIVTCSKCGKAMRLTLKR